MPKISVFSEIGKLKTVLVHRPGIEINNLHPKYLKKLLFDDTPYLEQMQKEHDVLTNTIKKAGVKVLYIKKLLLETLETVILEVKVKKILLKSF